MPSRDREIVEDYKKIMTNMVGSSPHLRQLSGTWYLFEQEGRVPKILLDDGSGFFIDEPWTMDRIKELGWTITPVIIHAVDTEKVR